MNPTVLKLMADAMAVNARVNIGTYEDKGDAIIARKSAEIKYGFHANHGRSAL